MSTGGEASEKNSHVYSISGIRMWEQGSGNRERENSRVNTSKS